MIHFDTLILVIVLELKRKSDTYNTFANAPKTTVYDGTEIKNKTRAFIYTLVDEQYNNNANYFLFKFIRKKVQYELFRYDAKQHRLYEINLKSEL